MEANTLDKKTPAVITHQQIKEIIEKQSAFFNAGGTKPIKFRKQKIKALKREIKVNEQAIFDALHKDFGKSNYESYITEIGLVYEEINTTLTHLSDWAEPRQVATPLTQFKGASYIHRVPYGVSLVIGPWNYPFHLAILPAIGAVAGGNTCIVKPSELTENTASILAKIITSVFDERHVAVVQGGVETATALLAEKFDHIFFTGSEYVGKIVARAAAENLTPTTLELGGKSPCIVDKDADLKVAAKRIVWGKFVNAGQTCVAPDYLLVHEQVKDKLVLLMKGVINTFYGENPKTSGDYPRIISRKNFDRLNLFLDQGKKIIGGESDADELYIAPTLLDDISWDDKVMQDEIFGPILPVLTFTDLEEMIHKINGRPRPLSLYYFSRNKKKQQRIVEAINFGGGCINDTLVHLGNPNLPFGGVGDSGMGAYHGKASFDTFTQQKSIMKKATWIDVPLRYPPYKGKLGVVRKIIK